MSFIDSAGTTVHAALSGLAARQRALADNIANVETPGFSAGRVDFEDSLSAAVRRGNPAGAEFSARRSTDAPGLNGNNVQVDNEVVALTDTGLRYNLMVEAMNAKFRLLRTAISGGR